MQQQTLLIVALSSIIQRFAVLAVFNSLEDNKQEKTNLLS